ncbi:GntR family transcriptional regulator [Rhodoferax ferrireducens]|uniref:GntR family transcriptional regulator n=1 Tax=Rhodoferax ferrireducens TaxID=192843 RepID=UPI000E0E01D5|nr:GntR family transcriptional regulator [Rhodoferax ferrireducens]
MNSFPIDSAGVAGGTGPTPDHPAPGQSRYGWLAASLRARITQGEWVPGTALPAEAALAKEHGVALGTLRQALALLVAEGLLERQHGRGTFVRAGLGGASMLRFFRFRQSDERGGTPQSTILQREVQLAAADTADALGLPSGASVLQLQRLRSVNGRPCLLEHLALPLPVFDALAQSDTAAWDDLLYPMYQRVCGVTINRAEDQLSFGLLNAEQAALLQLEAGHPCVQVQRRAFDLGGHCVELRTTLGDAFAFQYTAQVR